jgi:hypothetical protein
MAGIKLMNGPGKGKEFYWSDFPEYFNYPHIDNDVHWDRGINMALVHTGPKVIRYTRCEYINLIKRTSTHNTIFQRCIGYWIV